METGASLVHLVPMVTWTTWRRAVLGAGAGAVFALVLLAFLVLTGVLSASAGTYATQQILADALPRACEQLLPWLFIWLFVLPLAQRVPVAQPWSALVLSTAVAAAFVPLALNLPSVTALERASIAIVAVVTLMPIVRANDVWLSAAFVLTAHVVMTSVAGVSFGTTPGYGVFDARLSGDPFVTGGRLGPAFGVFGWLGWAWLAGALLQHQRRIFADAPRRIGGRREALGDFGVGLVVAAAAASVLFLATLFTAQARVAAFAPTLAALSASLTTALPIALAAEVVFSYVVVGALHRVIAARPIVLVCAVAVAIGWHAMTPGATALTMAGAGLVAAASASAYLATGRLWMPVALRFGWLLCAGTIYGFPLSGWPVRQAWFQLETVRYTAWSGGVHGPDASLLGALAKAVMVAAVLYVTRSRAESESR